MEHNQTFDVSSEIVVITGAAGQLGQQYVKAFLDAGSRVVGLDVARTQTVKDVSERWPNTFSFCVGDVTSKSSLQDALASIVEIFGVPTVLVNNAAIDSPPGSPAEDNGPFEEYPESSWDKVLDVNLKGIFLCCQVFGAAMAQAGRGAIVNVASVYGAVSPDQNIYKYRRQRGEVFYKPVAYSASKSGVLNLSRYLATYWAKSGVRVNSLTIAGVFNNQDEEFLQAYCNRIPIGRMADQDEYNGAVLFLASPATRYMTGSNLVIDGGWTAI